MKKRTLILINLIVSVIIFAGFVLITSLNNSNFNKIVENDIENISKLSSSTIYSQIDNSLSKPIFVGQTMANDLFLKSWIINEKNESKNQELIQDYLAEYQKKYGYDSVFLVSEKTKIYYHYQGINKIVSPLNQHDVWYYDFIATNEAYKLDVDFDEANNNDLTVFINCRIVGENGELLGVVGVGVKMNHLQELLRTCENDYNLKAFLMNDEGIVQVDSDAENIETANFFDNEFALAKKDNILNNHTSSELYWYPQNSVENCVITQYIKNLDWYIVVNKNTLPVREMLTSQFQLDLIYIIIIIMLVLLLSSTVIYSYNRLLINATTTDDVTNLPNIKMFHEMFRCNSKKITSRRGIFFMFDIDHFKKINDKYGHLVGNTVLYEISNMAKTEIGNKGLVARFGGDEFIGTIYADSKEANEILKSLFEKVSQNNYIEGYADITISIGATYIVPGKKIDTLIKETDLAMYYSKENGRNRITFFDKDNMKQ